MVLLNHDVFLATQRSRFLREYDRRINDSNYPKLYYPEVYLLDGGYRAFYEKYSVSVSILEVLNRQLPFSLSGFVQPQGLLPHG